LHALDDIDRALVRLLQQDCKQSLGKLGDAVGLSAPSVMERIRKLEAAGVVTGYHARIDAGRVGIDITAFVGVQINYPKDVESFLDLLSGWPEIQECHHVTGQHTLLLKVRAQNTDHLERIISMLRGAGGVTRTETMVVLSTATEHTRVEPPTEQSPRTEARRRRAPRT
jgi:Lrp/AsnC family leucine-responsive transcriptional regulator